MLCIGRDPLLLCSRKSLKSPSTVRFCRDHAPSGSTDVTDSRETPSPHDSDKVVAQFHRSETSIDETSSIPQEFDDKDDSNVYLLVLGQLANRNRDSTMLASLYVMSRSGVKSCKTAGCDRAARDSGYCLGCQNRPADGSNLPAIEYPDDDTASVEEVADSKLCKKTSSELSAEEVEARSLLEESEVVDDDDDAQSVCSSSRAVAATDIEQPRSVSGTRHQDTSLCRGPYCGNAGLERLQGLCVACYRTLLVYNLHYGASPADFDAGLD